MTDSQRRAITKAVKLGSAATVRRVQYGTYLVPSATSEGDSYVVTATPATIRHPC